MEKEGSSIGDKVDYRVYTQGSDGTSFHEKGLEMAIRIQLLVRLKYF